MKLCSVYAFAAGLLLTALPNLSPAAELPVSFIYETPYEFFGSGDFDGDGQTDLVIVDKETGKYRLGFASGGLFSWVDCRPSGLKGISGVSIGKLFTPKQEALAFVSPDATEFTLVEAASRIDTGKPLVVPFTVAMGPSTVVAAPGGAPLADLYIASVYNSPDPNVATLLRNDGSDFPKLAEAPLSAPAIKANRLTFKAGQPGLACALLHDDKGDTFRAENLSSGKPVVAATLAGLPPGADYAAGHFRGSPLLDLLFYKPGENNLLFRPVEETAPNQFQFGKGDTFELGQPVRRLVTLQQSAGQKLFVIFGKGEKAGVFNFDGAKAPVLVQTISATNDLFTCAAGLPDGFIAFLQPSSGKFSTRYQAFKATGTGYAPRAFGSLSSLADNDNITIPDIYQRIVANTTVTNEGEMKAYTNTIPGTRVSYTMVPIPAGEFLMGSPATEPNRGADEGPQHKVKISPFWMERCELTWNEYELFMYPDEEHRTRATIPTDPVADKLADAVSHPSKPYVEMSFGMGKDGFPAIAMTQHGANKYCQWLSAKTGQFYRLPTEAEWEYACRAGTTTAYFFGDDPSKLGEYGWYEENSDFKYQKVAKKKPNPWGLYDMCGNVVEWTLDQYDPNYYQQCANAGLAIDPWNKATKPYPHSVRGGSWDDPAVKCRSAARRGSDRSWKMQDPQLPKSVWYFSDAQWVGFRLVRPLKVPTAQEMQKYWSSGVERD